jgi:hypothetical protein
LKDLYDLCDLAPFTALYKEYLSRIAKLKEMQSLKEFAKHHPGLQHKGGVPNGGTFILVYRDLESDTVPPIKEIPDAIVEAIAAPIASTAVAAGTSLAAPASGVSMIATEVAAPIIKKLTAKEKVLAAQKVAILKEKGLVKTEIEKILGVGILDLLKVKGIFDKFVDLYEHGVVVADFYLPYLCCSDCPPIHFTVNIPPPKILFALDKPEYCGEDTEEYFFLTSPVGGVITTNDAQEDTILDKGNGVFVFLPNKAVIAADQQNVTISFTYAAEGLAQSISVKVYKKPDVKIVATTSAENPLMFTIGLDKPERVTSAAWSFGDNTFSNEINPPIHPYPVGGDYTINVEVKNGVCTAKPEGLTVTAKDPEPVKVELKEKEFCQIVKEVPFTITPPGGVLTGESFVESPAGSGKYIFSPSGLDMKGLSQRTITFNYISPQNQTATFSITVFAKPSGGVAAEPSGNLRVRLFFRELVNTFEITIDYGDNSPIEKYPVNGAPLFTAPLHQFPQKGAYTIKATLINGRCQTPLKEIVIEVTGAVDVQPLAKECPPLEELPATFKGIKAGIKENSAFKEYAQSASELEKFVKALTAAMDGAGNVDPKFFDKETIQPQWITQLPSAPASARSISVDILALLVNIILSGVCPRKMDIDGKLMEAFTALIETFKEMKVNATEKKIIQTLIEKIENEVVSTDAAEKPKYVERLKQLAEVMKSLL